MSNDVQGSASITIYVLDLAQNPSTTTQTTDGSFVIIDTIPPSFLPVSIYSSNHNSSMAKASDTITISLNVSEHVLQTPTVNIAQQSANVISTVLNYFLATYTVVTGDIQGKVAIYIDAFDTAGNENTTTLTTDGSLVILDTVPPQFLSVVIYSTNNNKTTAKAGENIIINFTSSELLLAIPSVTILGSTASVSYITPTSFQAQYTVISTDTQGSAAFLISGNDLVGNPNSISTTSTGTLVVVDTISPNFTSITIRSSNNNQSLAKAVDTITVSFGATEPLLTLPNVTIANRTANVVASGVNAYTATLIVQSSDIQGFVNITISGQDLAGNSRTQNNVSDNSYVIIDTIPPTFYSISISTNNKNSSMASIGNNITLTFLVTELLLQLPTVTMAGIPVTSSYIGSLSYSATLTVAANDIQGVVAMNISGYDLSGNFKQQNSTNDGTYAIIDTINPSFPYIRMFSNNANSSMASSTQTITVLLTSSELLSSIPAVYVAGSITAATVVFSGGLNYTATYVVGFSDTQGPAALSVHGVDLAQNFITQYNTTDNSFVIIDTINPYFTAITINSTNVDKTQARLGDSIYLYFTVSKILLSTPVVQMANVSATVVSVSSLSYVANLTVVNTTVQGIVAISISITDLARNNGTAVSTIDNSAVTVNTINPSFTGVSIFSTNTNTSMATINNVITLFFTSTQTLLLLPTVTMAGRAAIVTNIISTSYSAVLTVAQNDTQGTVQFSIFATDLARNNVTFTNVSDGTYVIIDTINPQILGTTIHSNNNKNHSLAKPGDIVTLNFNISENLLQTPIVTFAGQTANIFRVGNNVFVANLTIPSVITQGMIALVVSVLDFARNSAVATSLSDGSFVIIDTVPPVITLPTTIASNNAFANYWAKPYDTITLTLTVSELILTPSVIMASRSANVTAVTSTSFEATLNVQSNDTQGLVTFLIYNVFDLAGNVGANRSTVTDTSYVDIGN